MSAKTTQKASKEANGNGFIPEGMDLEYEGILKALNSLQGQIHALSSRLSRIESYQTQMDVILQNHGHNNLEKGNSK